MFIFTPRVILEEISIHMPQLFEKLEIIKKTIGTKNYKSTLEEIYPQIKGASIDYGIMEKTKRDILVVQAGFEWSDIGSWESLYELQSPESDSEGNILEGPGILFDTKNSHVSNKTDKFITVLGMEDVLVVNTEDVMLVTRLSISQKIKDITEILEEKNLEVYL